MSYHTSCSACGGSGVIARMPGLEYVKHVPAFGYTCGHCNGTGHIVEDDTPSRAYVAPMDTTPYQPPEPIPDSHPFTLGPLLADPSRRIYDPETEALLAKYSDEDTWELMYVLHRAGSAEALRLQAEGFHDTGISRTAEKLYARKRR